MNEDMTAWDFGDARGANRLVWEEYPELNKITQQLIHEVMPVGYKPYGPDDAGRFSLIKEKIKWLIDYDELESEKEWLAETIRYLLLPNHETDFELLFSNEPSSVIIMERKKKAEWKKRLAEIEKEKKRALENAVLNHSKIYELTERLNKMEPKDRGTSWKELLEQLD